MTSIVSWTEKSIYLKIPAYTAEKLVDEICSAKADTEELYSHYEENENEENPDFEDYKSAPERVEEKYENLTELSRSIRESLNFGG